MTIRAKLSYHKIKESLSNIFSSKYEEDNDISGNSYIAKHSASFFGKAYLASYMANMISGIISDGSRISDIDNPIFKDHLLLALTTTIPYSVSLCVSKFSDRLHNFITDIKDSVRKYKITDFLINNENVNSAFSAFTYSFLALSAWDRSDQFLPIIKGNVSLENQRYPDILHFSVGTGVGGYSSNPNDSLKTRIIRALSVGTILNGAWESFEQIGTRIDILHEKYPGSMTTDWLQDMANVYYGSAIGVAAHKIKDKFKEYRSRKKGLEEKIEEGV